MIMMIKLPSYLCRAN